MTMKCTSTHIHTRPRWQRYRFFACVWVCGCTRVVFESYAVAWVLSVVNSVTPLTTRQLYAICQFVRARVSRPYKAPLFRGQNIKRGCGVQVRGVGGWMKCGWPRCFLNSTLLTEAHRANRVPHIVYNHTHIVTRSLARTDAHTNTHTCARVKACARPERISLYNNVQATCRVI